MVLQVFSFRVFHRRIFRMAPIHHHFELKNWPETTVIIRFWIVSGLCTAMGLGLFYADFLSTGVSGSGGETETVQSVTTVTTDAPATTTGDG